MIPRTDNRLVYQYTNIAEIKYFQLYNNYFPKTYDIAFGGDSEGQSRRRKVWKANAIKIDLFLCQIQRIPKCNPNSSLRFF